MRMTFAARLNSMFDTVYPPGRGPHSSAEVVAALNAEGVTMSARYLSLLRSGSRASPSPATMTALANFFRIDSAYFTDDDYYQKVGVGAANEIAYSMGYGPEYIDRFLLDEGPDVR